MNKNVETHIAPYSTTYERGTFGDTKRCETCNTTVGYWDNIPNTCKQCGADAFIEFTARWSDDVKKWLQPREYERTERESKEARDAAHAKVEQDLIKTFSIDTLSIEELKVKVLGHRMHLLAYQVLCAVLGFILLAILVMSWVF